MRFPDSVEDLSTAIKARALTAREAVDHYLARIEAIDGELRCFRETYPDEAREAAGRVDAQISAGEDPGPLAGVPVAVKDNIVTSWGRTSAGSLILESYRSPYTATVVERLTGAGAIILGKTNCDEFAMGSSTEHCAFGATRNPWDAARVPGGSSGGSAAAVAARLCAAALGSDTGGSIRQPAALCGIVGLKPTYGRVSRRGLVAYGSSLDQIGPLTTTVGDAAAILQAIAGIDPLDSTSADIEVPDFTRDLDRAGAPLRIGVPKQYLGDRNDPEVNEAARAAADALSRLGADLVEVDLPLTDYGISTYYVLATAEASSNLARSDGIRYGRRAAAEGGEPADLDDLYARTRAEGFGPEVQRRVMLGTYVLSAGYYDAYYKRALQVRRLIKREFDAVFDRCDALLGPTSPFPAFKIGAKSDPLAMYLCDVYTAITNIAGHCALSLPAGFAERDGVRLPLGVQLQCRMFDEPKLFRIARMLETQDVSGRDRPPIACEAAA